MILNYNGETDAKITGFLYNTGMFGTCAPPCTVGMSPQYIDSLS